MASSRWAIHRLSAADLRMACSNLIYRDQHGYIGYSDTSDIPAADLGQGALAQDGRDQHQRRLHRRRVRRHPPAAPAPLEHRERAVKLELHEPGLEVPAARVGGALAVELRTLRMIIESFQSVYGIIGLN